MEQIEQLLVLIINRPSLIVRTSLLRRFSEDNYKLSPNLLVLLNPHIFPENHVRPIDYYEDWIPQYLEYDFFQLFRMTRNTFHRLLEKVAPAIRAQYVGGEMPLSAEKKLLMTLWWLGKGEVLLSVSDKFNVAISNVHKCTSLVVEVLASLRQTYIIWPRPHETQNIVQEFQNRGNIPGVLAAIDVCNIPFKAPKEQQDSYIDRKLQHSIKLQAMCIADKVFTNINVGWPGSVHDGRVFQNCEIYHRVVFEGNRNLYFPTMDHHIVADSAYPLLDWVLTPYRDNGNLPLWQRSFNYFHSNTRIVIEHTFGILKSRWRILIYVNVNSIDKAINIIVACCVLHNFCYFEGEMWENEEPPEGEIEDGNELYRHIADNLFGINKRNEIARTFM